jgi:hypothetical protein
VPTRALTTGISTLGKDTFKLGLGKRATAKAEALSPLLLNPSPAQASVDASRLFQSAVDYDAYVQALRPTRKLGMFGGSMGTLAGGQLGAAYSQ